MTAPALKVARGYDDSDDEALVRATVALIADRCSGIGFDGDHLPCWQALRDNGFSQLRAPDGGTGAAVADVSLTVVVLEEMGRSLCSCPLLPSTVAVEMLRLAGASGPQIEQLADDGRLAPVLLPNWRSFGDSLHGLGWGAVGAERGVALDGYRLTSVHLGSELSSADMTRAFWQLQESDDSIELALALDAVDRAVLFAQLAIVADSLGAAGALADAAVQYAGERVQFGRPIGSFQAVQHLCADNLVRIDAMRSALLYAAWALDRGATSLDARRACTIAKAYQATVLSGVVHDAMQVFGGIAATWEHPAHRYLRRIRTNAVLFGDAEYHLRSLSTIGR